MADTKKILLPGTDAWELWSKGSAGWEEVPDADGRAGSDVLVAIDARSIATAPLWINSTDPEIQKGVVAGELAELGIVAEGGRSANINQVAIDSNRALIVVTVLENSSRLPEVDGVPAGFAPFSSLLELPADAISVWRELGRLVVAFTRGRSVVYNQVLSGGEIDSDIAGEIACIAQSLQGNAVTKGIEKIVVSGEPAGSSSPEFLQTALGLPLQQVPRFPLSANPSALGASSPLAPVVVVERHAARRRRSRGIVLGIAALAIYGLLCLLAWLNLGRLDRANESLRESVAADADEVESIRQAMDSWDALEPAINPDNYPVETFHRLTALLPRKGLRLTLFHLQDFGQKLTVVGESESTNIAISLRDDLANRTQLSHFDWQIRAPTTLPDGRARFVAVGSFRENPFPLTEEPSP